MTLAVDQADMKADVSIKMDILTTAKLSPPLE